MISLAEYYNSCYTVHWRIEFLAFKSGGWVGVRRLRQIAIASSSLHIASLLELMIVKMQFEMKLY